MTDRQWDKIVGFLDFGTNKAFCESIRGGKPKIPSSLMISLHDHIAIRRGNNFNALRLFLALLVIFSHSFPLALGNGRHGEDPDPLNRWTQLQMSFGTMAVYAFFFISGFLITASWLRSESVFDYFIKRILRIYPGFIVALLFSAALVWAACPEFRAATHPLSWLWSLSQDMLKLDGRSIYGRGIFAGNPNPAAANGSLWTIPTEFSCYLFILVAGLFGLFKWRFLVLGAVVTGYGVCVSGLFHGNNKYDVFYSCFAMGALAWVWKDKIPFCSRTAIGCLVILLVTSHFAPWFSIVFPLAGGYCILWLAYGPQLTLANWTAKTDLSYGTYLYAYPIQQLLASLVPLRHPLTLFVLAAPLALLFAGLSWNLIEKRFLAMKALLGSTTGPNQRKDRPGAVLKVQNMAINQR